MNRRVVERMFRKQHRVLDGFNAGRRESVRSGYPVIMHTPIDGLTPSESREITASFEPRPSPMMLRAWGVDNPLDGLLVARVTHVGTLLTETNGHIRHGYKFEVRGRWYEPVDAIEGDGQILFILKDLKRVVEHD